ncbi:MAG: hypothetical protein ABI837_03075 [Acidobacteriota bacterium]
MTIGILITARCGSTRLSRKHLRETGGVPILSILIGRIRAAFAGELSTGDVVLAIATGDEPENRAFEKLPGVSVFYGSPENIPLRHLEAAEALRLDGVISVDGDDVFCSPRAMRAVFDALHSGAAYASTTGLPFGMNAAGYSTVFLRKSVESHRGHVLETGWGHIFDEAKLYTLPMHGLPDDERLRFTLDYPEDFEFFDRLLARLGGDALTADDAAIVQLALDSGLWEINRVVAAEYWRNFHARRQSERLQTEISES